MLIRTIMICLYLWCASLHASNLDCQRFCITSSSNVVWSAAWRRSQPLFVVTVAALYYQHLMQRINAPKPFKDETKATAILILDENGLVFESACVYKHDRCKYLPEPGTQFYPVPHTLIKNHMLKIEIDL